MDGGEFCIRPSVISDDSLRCFTKIGSGGFGQIYRAKHTEWGMDVAIKLLLYKDGAESSIQREANLMFQGGNPNVMRIFGLYKGRLGEERLPPRSGLVMEFMPKGSVAELLQTLAGPPPRPLAFRMAHQIGLGMNFLHHLSPPLLHLDLKPSNVLLNDSLDAKITDFGLSRVARSVSRCADSDEGEGGTLSYMPPEALQSVNYKASKASDVYSYGVLLWSLLTGKEPYDGVLSSLVRFRIPLGDRPDLTLIHLRETEGLEDLVALMESCWHQEPPKRPTFLDCVNATERILEMHQRGLIDAVRDVLKQLEGDVSSSLRSLQIAPEPQNETQPQESACATGSLPKQETAASYSSAVKKESAPRPAAAAMPPRTTQRQMSTPGDFKVKERSRRESGNSTGGVSIHMSNVTGFQFGHYNTMNIVQKPRQRHRTASPSYSKSSQKYQ